MASSRDASPAMLINAADSSSINTEEGPASFFCRQCQSAYRQPRILKCLHSFCTSCLEEILAKAENKTALACPICAYSTPLPAGGVQHLPLNSFLQRVSNEYVAGVKSSLASKSSSTHTTKEKENQGDEHNTTASSKSEGLKKEVSFHEDIGLQKQRSANLTDEQKFKTFRDPPGTTEGKDKEESEATVQKAIQNMGRLQAKLAGLQGEALKVTYAIDRVNHHKIEWLHHREDLRRTIQRRSAQFQMMVKKMERKLIAQIDDKNVEDKLYESFEKGKTELRKGLKQVLHEVAVMKGVREMGSYAEINEISSCLLGPSVGINEVVLDRISYKFDQPTKSIDEMVSVGFGSLVKTADERAVYRPELKDYASLKMDEINEEAQRVQSFALNRVGVVSAIAGDSTAIGSIGHQRSSPGVVRKTSTIQRRRSDVGRESELVEFQNARESLRYRRQEILQQARHSVSTSSSPSISPRRGDGKRLSRPPGRKSRTGTSLERGDGKQGLLRTMSDRRGEKPKVGGIGGGGGGGGETSEDDDHDTSSTSSTETSERCKSEFGSQTFKAEITMPSPIIEENAPLSLLNSSPPAAAKTGVAASATTDTVHAQASSPGGPASTGRSKSFRELMQISRSPSSPTSSPSSSRRVSSDHSPCLSPTTEHSTSPDLLWRSGDGANTRPLRRAITSAADKRTKIEFLRENWQKRKEILIQNQGFVSAEELKSPKPDPSSVKSLISASGSSPPTGEGYLKAENGMHTQIPLASRGIGSPPLRSKFTSVKKTHLEHKKYENADIVKPAKVSPKRFFSFNETSLSPRSPAALTREYGSPSDAAAGDGTTKRVQESTVFFPSSTPTKTPGGNLSGRSADKEDDAGEDDEETEVVETETMTVPLTTTQLSHRATTNTATTRAYDETDAPGATTANATTKTFTGEPVSQSTSSRLSTHYQDLRENFYKNTQEETATTSPRIDLTRQEQMQTRSTSVLYSSSSPNAPSTLRTDTPTQQDRDPGVTTLSCVDSRTRTLTPTSATVSVSPTKDSGRSAEFSLVAQIDQPVHNTENTNTSTDTSTYSTDRSPYTARRTSSSSLYSKPSASATSTIKVDSPSVAAVSRTASDSAIAADRASRITGLPTSSTSGSVATSANTASASATGSSIKTSMSTSAATTSSSAAATSTTTTSASSKTSWSSTTSRYYRPNKPAASPFAHLYGPPAPAPATAPAPAATTTSTIPDTASGTEKSKNDDNKENIIMNSQSSSTTKTTTSYPINKSAYAGQSGSSSSSSSSSSSYYSRSHTEPDTRRKEQEVVGSESMKETERGVSTIESSSGSSTATSSRRDHTLDSTAADVNKSGSRTSSLYSDNSVTSSRTSTRSLYSASPGSSVHREIKSFSSVDHLNRTSADTKTAADMRVTATTTPTTERDLGKMADTDPASSGPLSPTHAKISESSGSGGSSSSGSMYSKFYSNTSALYSKSPEGERKQFDHQQQEQQQPGSSQDKMVDETFTHAESTRKVYDPAAGRLSRSRRHTVEVGKTLPSGVTIQELYDRHQIQKQYQDAGSSIVSSLRSPQRAVTVAETIQELRTENENDNEELALSEISPSGQSGQGGGTAALSPLLSPRGLTASAAMRRETRRESDPGDVISNASSYYSHRSRLQQNSPTTASHTAAVAAPPASLVTRSRTMPPKQHSLPEKPEVRFVGIDERLAKYRAAQESTRVLAATAFGRQKSRMASSQSATHLSTSSSSPAGSPVVEEKKFVVRQDSEGSVGSEGGQAGAVTEKTLKDIARKKRERWRRLTVY